MIIVIGSVTVSESTRAQALEHSAKHVARSRLEPGCISHEVSLDGENPNRLIFIERWASMEDLELHFQVPESSEFVTAIAQLATVAPDMQLYESDEIKRH